MADGVSIPESFLARLNKQSNRIRRECIFRAGGALPRLRLYSVGLGERHLASFLKEIDRLSSMFTWASRNGVREVVGGVICIAQSSMLNQISKAIDRNGQSAGFMPVTVYISDKTFLLCIEEFGEFFEHFGYVTRLKYQHYKGGYHDEMKRTSLTLADKVRASKIFVLRKNGKLSGESRLPVDARVLDTVLCETEFCRNGINMWHRVFCRIDNI